VVVVVVAAFTATVAMLVLDDDKGNRSPVASGDLCWWRPFLKDYGCRIQRYAFRGRRIGAFLDDCPFLTEQGYRGRADQRCPEK